MRSESIRALDNTGSSVILRSPMPTIAVLGTLDTKGEEHAYVAKLIRERGHTPLLIDVGTEQAPKVAADVSREEVARIAGLDLGALMARHDRGECVAAMGQAAAAVLSDLASRGAIQGVISLGGGGGTSIATTGMRALPLGFPKVMVSTLAAGNVAPYLGVKDIAMFPAIVDVQGLNRISQMVFSRAAAAVCGMVDAAAKVEDSGAGDRPIIVASMFGNTTACVSHAVKLLEGKGYEVLVFHATGTGGRTMESLIETGLVAGVLDITTTEWADELVGGVLGAGPTRLDAAAKGRVPAIITPGCLDMVNFGSPESVPAKFAGRTFYQHNPQVTLMRTTPEECAELGRILAEKANASVGPVSVLLPKKAISVISAPGQAFHSAEADAALFDGVKAHLKPGIPLIELDVEINDPAFAEACVAELLRGMEKARAV